jgi:hypothetical protein
VLSSMSIWVTVFGTSKSRVDYINIVSVYIANLIVHHYESTLLVIG